VRPGLRVVSINTNYYVPENFWLYENHTDFSCQMFWLEDVFKQATALGEKIILIGHAATASMFDDFAISLNTLIEKYSSIILDQFYGHAHTSTYQLTFDNKTGTVPFVVSYIVGSVTTYSQLNPGYRIYQYDRSKFHQTQLSLELQNEDNNSDNDHLVTNFAHYWIDLVDANRHPDQSPNWATKRYSALETYNLTDCSVQSWVNFAKQMLKDDDIYQTYKNNYYRGVSQSSPESANDLYCEIMSPTKAAAKLCFKESY